MIKTLNIFDKNNCFTVIHNSEEYVESVIIDTDKKEISIQYQFDISPEKEDEIIIEEYTKFGVLTNSTTYKITGVIECQDDFIKYSYE